MLSHRWGKKGAHSFVPLPDSLVIWILHGQLTRGNLEEQGDFGMGILQFNFITPLSPIVP